MSSQSECPSIEAALSNESRLQALYALDVLDTPPERSFDRISELVQLIFGVEIGIVSMIDAHRQWYKSVQGLTTSEASIDGTFCRYTLQLGRPVIVPDATKDPRFYENPHVTSGPRIRFYAGVPICTSDGEVIGTVCAIDSQVRDFGQRETAILSHLAALVMRDLELRQDATTDVLTGAGTRRAFKDEATTHLALAARHDMPLSCIVMDIDHFKSINDTYGHAAGDQVLVALVRTLKKELRQSDVVGRMGGEEFAVILPQTDLKTAGRVAEKLRFLVKDLRFPGSRPPIAFTASFGIAQLDRGEDLDGLLHRADQALYVSKRGGRDRTSSASPSNAAGKKNQRRVLKAGQIIFNDGRSTYDCTIRSIWEGGAEIVLSLPTVVPDTFDLKFKGTLEKRRCSIIGRSANALEAGFLE